MHELMRYYTFFFHIRFPNLVCTSWSGLTSFQVLNGHMGS